MASQQLGEFFTRNWLWILIAVVIIISIVVAMKNKAVKKKMNSLFKWPPAP